MNAIAEMDHDNQRIIRETVPIRQVVQSEEIAPVQSGCPKLSEALAQARDRCKMAIKGSRNEFSKYDYASADEVIGTAKQAMSGLGLALIPQLQELVVIGDGAMALYALNRTMLLSHSSGEFVPLSVRGWPVVPIKGSPLDKAFAIALTSSLSYLYRDLLQMERGKESDMNARNEDPRHEPTKPASKPPAQHKPVDEGTLNDLRQELSDLIAKLAFARDVEPDLVFGKLSTMVKTKFPGAGKSTDTWLKSELDYAIASAKKSIADAEAQPSKPAEAQQPAPAKSALEVMIGDTQIDMANCGVKWPAILDAAPKIFGRVLPKGTYLRDLSIEDLTKVQDYCHKVKALSQTA